MNAKHVWLLMSILTIIKEDVAILAHKNILNHTHQASINLEYINFDCNAWLTIRFEYDLRSRKNMKKSPKMECRKGHTWVKITYNINMLKHISSCNISIVIY